MITYKVGSAAAPATGTWPCVITHVVNDVGRWGKGFTASLDEVYPAAAASYLEWSSPARPSSVPFRLGNTLIAALAPPDVYVAHLCAQHGLPSRDNPHPLNLVTLEACLGELATMLGRARRDYTVVMPRIGTGFGGAKWSTIEPIIEACFPGRQVIVYTRGPA
ncbi:MAG: hypothetical protein Q8Q85_06635 [Gemmatimonadales bacterium]|nr:hypothetical protein [Gemmatimonadales bacterium]